MTILSRTKKQKGQIIIHALVFGFVAFVFMSSLASWAVINIKASSRAVNQELAFQIAEAGIEYYRWHLAHAPTDYQDGTGQPGPYVHDFYDKDNNVIGQFTLNITPPPVGSTIVTINSTGTVNSDSEAVSVVEAQLAIPSLAKYSVAVNSDVRFGAGTTALGPIHSNGGVRFDGVAFNLVTSAKENYDDPDHAGGNEFGVHTHVNPVDPLPPQDVPVRDDVFMVGRQFPVPMVDFAGFTSDLANIKSNAQNDGLYFADSGELGYHITFNTNNTFNLFKVTSLVPQPNGWCSNWANEDRWGTWSINNESFIGTYTIPENGLVFVEDDVWVDGQINSSRVTIASGRFPENSSTYTNIIVNNDLLYTNYDGQDVISLMAQGDVLIGLVSENDLRVDAALVAQNGKVGRNFYYSPFCGETSLRNSITLYGIIATNQRYGLAWGCWWGFCSGYAERNIVYDANLLYGPPPSFPLTASQYETISWKKIK